MTLLETIASLDNIELSFRQCLRGKRNAVGAQKVFQRLDTAIPQMRENLLAGQAYPWGAYRGFYVTDPKRRLVHSAPFFDRVAHRAIYNVLEPILHGQLLPCAFACRPGLGNGRAVAKLMEVLSREPAGYVVKLDVRKFFESVCARRLIAKLRGALPDDSADGLIRGLLRSHPQFAHGVGLPLGNLSSQIFANFYMGEIDRFIWDRIGDAYLRYMDDLVLVMRDRAEARELVPAVVALGRREHLTFPARKRVWLGASGQVPFLGFLVTAHEAVPLNRNRRRYERRCRRHAKAKVLPSSQARRQLSYEAWKEFPMRVRRKCATDEELPPPEGAREREGGRSEPSQGDSSVLTG